MYSDNWLAHFQRPVFYSLRSWPARTDYWFLGWTCTAEAVAEVGRWSWLNCCSVESLRAFIACFDHSWAVAADEATFIARYYTGLGSLWHSGAAGFAYSKFAEFDFGCRCFVWVQRSGRPWRTIASWKFAAISYQLEDLVRRYSLRFNLYHLLYSCLIASLRSTASSSAMMPGDAGTYADSTRSVSSRSSVSSFNWSSWCWAWLKISQLCPATSRVHLHLP